MFNPYAVLGIPSTSTKEEAKQAYRRLASRWHPDKVVAEEHLIATEKFKQIKGAFEMIDNGWSNSTPYSAPPAPPPQYAPERSSFSGGRPGRQQQSSGRYKESESAFKGIYEDPSSPWYDPTFGKPKAPPQSPRWTQATPPPPKFEPKIVEAYPALQNTRKSLGEFVARVSIGEAYKGFILEVKVDGQTIQVPMPKGIPHGMRNTLSVDGDDITVTTLFNQSEYQFIGVQNLTPTPVIVNSEPGLVYRVRDLKAHKVITTTEHARGTSFKMVDILGETFNVSIPKDYDLRIPFKVPKRGYVDWYPSHSQAGTERGDLYITFSRTENVQMSHLKK